ncbi:DUF4145 domain-containing protein [Mesorhizobium sp. Z1-4]|uniref:DUF4145 domain-containing protein n=1 Tax=Mesorhizobium sp. Z1-4 TaxID=2448478 RepID=UPI0013E0A2F3|nr:DUF4145 domain-containing protein [Mesorhizobium sp. Z1-4]
MKIVGWYTAPPEFVEKNRQAPFANVFATCGNCIGPVSAKITSNKYGKHEQYQFFIQEFSSAIAKDYSIESGSLASIVVRTPNEVSGTPGHLSEPVKKAFRSAERNFKAEDGEDAAAMLYRRSIDIAIREKHPEIKGNLAPRIAKLAEKGLIPPAMKEWADQIRLIGNDGAHEPEGVTKEDLAPMRGFTEAFLRYFITIPFEVAKYREQ